MSWTLTINSTDRTAYAVAPSLRVSNTGYAGLGTLSVDLHDPDNDLSGLANEQTVSLVQDATTIFAGRIRVIEKTQSGLRGTRLYRIRAQDYTQDAYDDVADDANRTATESDSTRIAWLFGGGAGFNTHGVTVGTAVKTVESNLGPYDFSGMTLGEAMDSICDLTGGAWYIDSTQALHYFATETYAVPFNLTDSSPNHTTTFGYRDFSLPYDTTEYASDVFVVGNNVSGWVTDASPSFTPRRYKVLRDSSIEDSTALNQAGSAFLTAHGTAVRTGSLTVDEPGLKAGQTIQITNTAHGLSAESFRIQSVDTAIDPRTLEPVHTIRFGDEPPSLAGYWGGISAGVTRATSGATTAVSIADLSIAGANQVTNSSFENASTTGWTVGSNWVFGYGAGTGTAFAGTAVARGTTSAATLGALDTDFIWVDRTDDWVVSSWQYLRSYTSGTATFEVVEYNAAQAALSTATIATHTAAGTAWGRDSLLLGPNTSLGRTQWQATTQYVKLRWRTTGTSTLTWDVDGVQVERGGRVTAYAPRPQELGDGAITVTQIADDAVTTDKLIANAVTAGKIAGSAVTADKINASAVTADKIAAGAVTAEKIAANAITVGKMQIAAGSLLSNPGFELDGDTDPGDPITGWVAEVGDEAYVQTSPSTQRSGTYALRIEQPNPVSTIRLNSERIPIEGGARYRMRVWVRGLGSNSATATALLRRLWYDGAGSNISSGSFTTVVGTSTTYQVMETITVAPTNAAYMYFQIENNNASAVGDIVYFDDAELYRVDNDLSHAAGEVVINSSGITVTNGAITVSNPGGTAIIDGQSQMFKVSAEGTLSVAVSTGGATGTATLTALGSATTTPGHMSYIANGNVTTARQHLGYMYYNAAAPGYISNTSLGPVNQGVAYAMAFGMVATQLNPGGTPQVIINGYNTAGTTFYGRYYVLKEAAL